MRRLIEIGIPLLVGLAGLALLGMWALSSHPGPAVVRPVVARQQDNAPRATCATPAQTAATPAASPTVAPAPAVENGGVAPAAPVVPVSGSWPRFRGDYNGISADRAPLARSWGASGPRRLWAVKTGEGYAGAAVRNGRVYLMDYDAAAQQDVLRCFSLADGRELWRTGYRIALGKQHGITRTVPAVTDKYVVTIGPRCQVMCADAATGKQYWRHDLVAEYGTVVPEWYTGQCPLIDGGRAIVAPGGAALMVAYDLATGKEAWRAPNPDGWQMTHSSILPYALAGQRMYVYCASGGVAGVSAKDGTTLWKTADWVVHTANIPTPVPIGADRLLLSGGYGAGSLMLRLQASGGAITPSTVFRLKESEFGAYQQTPIFYDGFIYGVVPNGQLVCLSPDGETMWKSGTANRYAWNAYVLAGGMLYLLNDRGELNLVTATPDGFHLLAKAKVLSGGEYWGPMAVAGRRLLIRDLTSLVCLDIGE
jgi:outer membrane protein assembly factor BamB